MPWRPVGALPLSEQIHQQLLNAIIDGTLTDTLPPERELAASFQVNRHVIREAVKRLQQANLVEVNQGGATRVLPIHQNARLDLMPAVMVRAGVLDTSAAQAVLEMRACIGADAARLCALRSPAVGEQLMAYLPSPGISDTELVTRNLAFWSAIIDGSQNLAYRLALNTLIPTLDAIESAEGGAAYMNAMYSEYRRLDEVTALATAIGKGDAEAAQRIANDLMTTTLDPSEPADAPS